MIIVAGKLGVEVWNMSKIYSGNVLCTNLLFKQYDVHYIAKTIHNH